jgi:hypothetical protein
MTSKIIFNPTEGTVNRVFTSGATRESVGTLCKDGYLQLWMDGRKVMLHRAIWEHVNGPIPDGQEIDHINGNRQDNRIGNLRLVTRKQNQENMRSAFITNVTSGIKGVSFYKTTGKWRAQIRHWKRSIHLGYFDSMTAAQSAYQQAAARLHTHNPSAKENPEVLRTSGQPFKETPMKVTTALSRGIL